MSASIPNFLCQEQVSLGEGYLKQPFRVRDGFLELPTGPGLGIELDENAMADKLGHDWRNPESFGPYHSGFNFPITRFKVRWFNRVATPSI